MKAVVRFKDMLRRFGIKPCRCKGCPSPTIDDGGVLLNVFVVIACSNTCISQTEGVEFTTPKTSGELYPRTPGVFYFINIIIHRVCRALHG